MTDFLTVDDLIRVARGAVGPQVILADAGLLGSAAARPQVTVFGDDAYDGLDGKAAALLISLVKNHALVDGNKRLGWAAAVVFCRLNDVDLAPTSHDEAFDLVMSIADGRLVDVVEVAKALRLWMS